MSTQPKTIDDISRTKTVIDGTERVPGRDSLGDFKITIADLVSSYVGSIDLNVFSRIRKNGSSNEILVPPFHTIFDGEKYFTISEKTLGVADLDTGSAFVFGSDYYVWAGVPASGKTPVLKISLSAINPIGLTTPKIIGGFHYGKIRNSITISDVSDGIVPNSCWDCGMPRSRPP